MEVHPSQITALKARVMMAATSQELSILWQEMGQLKSSYMANADATTAAHQVPWNCPTASRSPTWGSDATSSTAVSTPRRVAPAFAEAVEEDGYATPVRWAGDGVCSDSSQSPPPSQLQSPTTFVIRNTFIEFLDPEENETQGQTGPMARLVKTCPPTPKGSCDPIDSINTLTAAAERLAHVSPVTLQAQPAKQEVDFLGSYAPDGNNTDLLRVIRLADSLEELPSQGSALHSAGRCKPCAFVHTKGCNTGKACQFCHLCDQGSSKRRKKALREYLRTTCAGSRDDRHAKVIPGTVAPMRIVPR
mmetsp:Transcript_123924/g.246700  ORF Transcript_123924/g.246700 Transcript_123924/m.246700 type:complete len:304 (+) Transcript_123924:130-1041(+)